MSGHDILVVGASAGGVSALRRLIGGLPADFPAAVFIVLHMNGREPSQLAQILTKAGHLPVAMAVDGEPISFGEVRVARPDHHLIIEQGRLCVIQGPKENRHRPAIDALFRSAAREFGGRVIAVVLTGNLDDGTAGLWAVERAGGLTVVQDPQDAEYPDMPKNARAGVDIDHCVALRDMPRLLVSLANIPLVEEAKMEDHTHEVPGVAYLCPDCNGPLREIKIGNEKLVRFRCLVGHAFTMMTLLEAQAEVREARLWSAVVALEHEAFISERAAEHARTHNDLQAAAVLVQEAELARQHGQVIRKMIVSESELVASVSVK